MASLDLKGLSPHANPGKPEQVPGVVMFGKALLLLRSSIQVDTDPVVVLFFDGTDHEPLPERRDLHPGVYRRPSVQN